MYIHVHAYTHPCMYACAMVCMCVLTSLCVGVLWNLMDVPLQDGEPYIIHHYIIIKTKMTAKMCTVLPHLNKQVSEYKFVQFDPET